MTRVKICGITHREDALLAARLGAWAVGFIFYRKSPRYVSPARAAVIIRDLPPFVTPVGVFVNERENAVKRIARQCGFSTLQFHGDESSSYCRRFRGWKVIKAVRVSSAPPLSELKKFQVDAFLFDTLTPKLYGGSGTSFDWSALKSVNRLKTPWILSGGLNAKNIRRAASRGAWALDVSSGVESIPGRKSPVKLKALLGALG